MGEVRDAIIGGRRVVLHGLTADEALSALMAPPTSESAERAWEMILLSGPHPTWSMKEAFCAGYVNGAFSGGVRD